MSVRHCGAMLECGGRDEKSQIQGHPAVLSECEVSLDYTRQSLKTTLILTGDFFDYLHERTKGLVKE